MAPGHPAGTTTLRAPQNRLGWRRSLPRATGSPYARGGSSARRRHSSGTAWSCVAGYRIDQNHGHGGDTLAATNQAELLRCRRLDVHGFRLQTQELGEPTPHGLPVRADARTFRRG